MPCDSHGISRKLARPERFELPTPRFVVWCLLGGSESDPKPAHQPRAFYATGAE